LKQAAEHTQQAAEHSRSAAEQLERAFRVVTATQDDYLDLGETVTRLESTVLVAALGEPTAQNPAGPGGGS
jgi:hypothetical protein